MHIKAFICAAALAVFAVPALAANAPIGQAVAGWDSGSTVQRTLSVDSLGRLNVVGSASGGSVFGNNASGTAPTQAPVFVGGWDGTLVRSIKTDSNGVLLTSTTAAGALTSGTSLSTVPGFMVGGSDGTNYRHFKTDASGVLYTQGPAVVGSATGTQANMVAGSDGTLARFISTDTSGHPVIVGNTASGIADSGNPVKIGGVYNSTLPTFTTGQRGDLQITPKGALEITPYDGSGNSMANASSGDGMGAVNGINAISVPYLYNGATWDRTRAIGGVVSGAATGVLAVSIAPNNNPSAATIPVVSSAVESGHVLKASAGNFYRLSVTTGAVAGYVLVFNATTVPADGAVAPQLCRAVAANSSIEIDHTVIPQRYSTGISAAFSTTGCFTKTASATAMFEGDVE